MKYYIYLKSEDENYELVCSGRNFFIPKNKLDETFKEGKTYSFRNREFVVFVYDETERDKTNGADVVYQIEPVESLTKDEAYTFKIIKKI